MLRLFVNLFLPQEKARRKEILECFDRNASNKGIDAFVSIDGRPTFQDLFAFANNFAQAEDVSIFANADIYLDRVDQFYQLKSNECFALTRYDMVNGKPLFHGAVLSQDVWAFRGQIKIPNVPFAMGVRGCDNRLAAELAAVGYSVRNPCLSIRTYHLHESRLRAANYHDQSISPPYKRLPFEEV